MNRCRKIAAMAVQNEANKQICVNKNTNTGKVENWIDNGNGIEFDTNRLNGIFINDYDMVINTSFDFDELVENNTTFNYNTITIATTQLNSNIDEIENNHILYDTDENNIILDEGIKECPILINNSQSDIISEVVENQILLESEIDTESTSTIVNNLDEQLIKINGGQRQVKYQSRNKRLAGEEYFGFKMVVGKIVQGVLIGKRTIKPRCNHSLLNQKSSNSFMCG